MVKPRVDVDLERKFTYHPATPEKALRFTVLREHAKAFGMLIKEACPDGRERAIAITKLEELIMWANAAIAREEPSPPEEAG